MALVQALDELLLHHTVEGDVGQIWDESIAGTSADSLTASEVQQSQRGETLQVRQAAVRQLVATLQTQTSQDLNEEMRWARVTSAGNQLKQLIAINH